MNITVRTTILPLVCLCLSACVPAFLKGRSNDDHAAVMAATMHRLELNRAIYLKHEIDILNSAPPGAISPASSWKLSRNRRELAAMADDLMECGRWAMKNGERILARKCLTLATEIKPSPEIDTLLAKLAKGEKAEPGRSESSDLAFSPKIAGDKIRAAIRDDKLALAVKLAAEQHSRGITLDHDLGKKLRLEVSARTTEILRKARNFYSSGAMDKAESLWNDVLILDPRNQEAVNGLDRLRKVQKRLESLSKDARGQGTEIQKR